MEHQDKLLHEQLNEVKKNLDLTYLKEIWASQDQLNTILESHLLHEKFFYNYCVQKIKIVMESWKPESKKLVVYFDLDETLVKYWEMRLRPIAPYLFKTLKEFYWTEISFWILSSRWEENIISFAQLYPEYFELTKCVSSRWLEWWVFDEEIYKAKRWEWSSWYYTKIKAFDGLETWENEYNILIDDIIEAQFETQKMWFKLPKEWLALIQQEK